MLQIQNEEQANQVIEIIRPLVNGGFSIICCVDFSTRSVEILKDQDVFDILTLPSGGIMLSVSYGVVPTTGPQEIDLVSDVNSKLRIKIENKLFVFLLRYDNHEDFYRARLKLDSLARGE